MLFPFQIELASHLKKMKVRFILMLSLHTSESPRKTSKNTDQAGCIGMLYKATGSSLRKQKRWGSEDREIKNMNTSRVWWRMPLIPALGRQRQAYFWVRGQPGLQSEFQDSQTYTEEPVSKNKTKQQQQQQQQNVSHIIHLNSEE